MKNLLRKIRLYLGKLILDKTVSTYPIPDSPRIIVLQQDGKIGDYIVSSFIFRELKRQFPQAQVDVLCSKNNLNLFEQNPFIDRYYVVNRKEAFAYTRMGLLLAKNHYDVCINLPVLIRNRDLLLMRLIQAKNNIGFLKSDYRLFNLNVKNAQQHFSQVYAEAIKLIGVTNINATYEIPEQSSQKAAITQFIQQHQLTNGVAINFFGAAHSRQFSEESICAFLDYLIQIAPQRKWLLLTYPAVTPLLARITEKYSNVFLYKNTENIFDSIELIKYMEWVISPDTSIIHIASGLNKKIIGFYRTADKENNAHWHPNSENECHIISFTQNVNEISPQQIKANWLK